MLSFFAMVIPFVQWPSYAVQEIIVFQTIHILHAPKIHPKLFYKMLLHQHEMHSLRNCMCFVVVVVVLPSEKKKKKNHETKKKKILKKQSNMKKT